MIRIKSWNISVMWYFGNGQQAYYFNFIGICEKVDGDVNFSDLKHNGFPEMNTQPFYWRIGVRLDVKSDTVWDAGLARAFTLLWQMTVLQ